MQPVITRVLSSSTGDGRTASVTVETSDGEQQTLLFATETVDWLAYGLFGAASNAYERRAHLQGEHPPVLQEPDLEVSGHRAIPDKVGRRVVLQVLGADMETRHARMISLSLTPKMAKQVFLDLMQAQLALE
ncbi:MAG: hypothetical protein NW206_07680 [Hyphomonadaceae bacterium]|nr:hypothetical protein [Hyphomonadaceae bacterium]